MPMTTITSFATTPEPTGPATDQLYHADCSVDGRWQEFDLIGADLGDGLADLGDGLPVGFVGASVAVVAGELTLVGVGIDGQLYHTARNPDGSWREFLGLRPGRIGGGPRDFYAACCAGTGTGLALVGLGCDGRLYHAIGRPSGRWQDEFVPINAELHRGPEAFAAAACAGAGESLHLVALDNGGQAYHSIHDPRHGWQSFRGLGQLYDAPARFVAIDCAAVADGSLHIVGVGSDARLHHAIRWPDGSWQRYFGVLGGQQHGVVPRFTLSVACAARGSALELVAICSDHRLFRCTRASDGSWRGSLRFGDGQLRNGPPDFYGLSCACTGAALHVVGGTWQGGFA